MKKFIFYDTETTGLKELNYVQVIQIGSLLTDENFKDHSLDCTQGTGNINDFNADLCRVATIGEEPCIFPFYWNGKLYEQCVFLEEMEFLFPVFRCPVRNITRKIDGINSFFYRDIIREVFNLYLEEMISSLYSFIEEVKKHFYRKRLDFV